MSVSYELFDAISAFDRVRRQNRDEYLNTLKSISRYQNSAGYDRDKETAEKKRRTADETAKKEAVRKINDCLKRMRENASHVPLEAPTPEMVSILQVLSMREKPTRQDFDRACESMKGNSLALSALNDIASKHYTVHPNYMTHCKDLSAEATESLIKSLGKYCGEILASPVKHSALMGAQMNRNLHGTPYNEDDLPQRGEIVSERAFYGDVVSDSMYDSFMKVVNG